MKFRHSRNLGAGIFLCGLAVISQPALAATEYLRFEGRVAPSYTGDWTYCCSRPDPTIVLQANQTVYFDFAVDTAVQPLGRVDSFYQDFFSSSYLTGSVAPPLNSVGVTSLFPEGRTTWLTGNSLNIGMSWSRLTAPYNKDFNLGTWAVGTSLDLMQYRYFASDIIGSLTLTYRSTTLPPAYVPIPAPALPFASALAGLGLARRRPLALVQGRGLPRVRPIIQRDSAAART